MLISGTSGPMCILYGAADADCLNYTGAAFHSPPSPGDISICSLTSLSQSDCAALNAYAPWQYPTFEIVYIIYLFIYFVCCHS